MLATQYALQIFLEVTYEQPHSHLSILCSYITGISRFLCFFFCSICTALYCLLKDYIRAETIRSPTLNITQSSVTKHKILLFVPIEDHTTVCGPTTVTIRKKKVSNTENCYLQERGSHSPFERYSVPTIPSSSFFLLIRCYLELQTKSKTLQHRGALPVLCTPTDSSRVRRAVL